VIVSPEAFATIRISGLAGLEAEALAAEAFVVVVLDAAAGLIGFRETGEAINRTNPDLEQHNGPTQKGIEQSGSATTNVGRGIQMWAIRDEIAQPGALNGFDRSAHDKRVDGSMLRCRVEASRRSGAPAHQTGGVEAD
jgi:hypothetical protein